MGPAERVAPATDPLNLIRVIPAKGGRVSSVLERAEHLPEWGIEPVPRDRRSLSGLDLAILWGDLGIGLLVLVTGALLVPALGFWAALGAIVIGSVIGVALLALAGVAGADHGIPSMVLFRPVLGLRGSWLPSGLNTVQLIGWTAVELWAMSFVADLVGSRLFGFSARWLWLLIAALVCIALAAWGPVGVTRVWMKRFSAWLIVAISLVVTVLVLTQEGILSVLSAPGSGGLPFGAAMDLVIAMPISWLPLVADYNRFARRPSGAFRGTFAGYLIANIWLYSLGALLVIANDAAPSPEGVAAAILALAGGSIAGVVFLVGLLAGETDEAFADIYSGAMSLQNIWPRVPQRVFVLAIGGIATLLAAWLSMTRYELFLFLIGSVFTPLFGVLVADYFIARRRSIQVDQLYVVGGSYWYARGVAWDSFLPWLAGFVVYHWLVGPVGPFPLWWQELTGNLFGSALATKVPWLGASIPSFATAALLTLVVRRLSSGHSIK